MSLKRDFQRLGVAFDALEPEQRERIGAGLAHFSRLLQQLRPTCEAIGRDIATGIDPVVAKRLGRTLRDVGVGLVLSYARGLAFASAEDAASVLFVKVADAVEGLPMSTSATFQPLLEPWQEG